MKLTAKQVVEALIDLDLAEREEALRMLDPVLRERGIALETATDKLMSASALHDRVDNLVGQIEQVESGLLAMARREHYHADTKAASPAIEQWQSRLQDVERDAKRLDRLVGSHTDDIDRLHDRITMVEDNYDKE